MEKATSKFEERLKKKIQETLQHIHELTQVEFGTKQTVTENDEEEINEQELEDNVETLTEEIEKESNTVIRKEICQKRSKFKKSLKLIREDFHQD